MKNAITIRPARNHDARRIFNILCELEERLLDQQEFELNYRVCLADNNNIYLVAADQNNETVGFISSHGQILLHHGRMVYEIQEMFVGKGYRNRGVGKLLLKGLEKHLSQRDYKLLEVTTHKKRIDLINFYAKNGFEETHLKFTQNKK